jgi:YebC/PmpR family DNA-binding regulatory protein
MSGHSKWSTIKRQKGLTDAKRGAVFTKIGNIIAIAAKNGSDPSVNSALAMAIEKARAANMPTSNIDRAIQRAKDKGSADLIEIMYEGYGPGGVGVLVECATDNLNRTYPEVKLAFSKTGGSIAEKGSVAFQFRRVGQIRVNASGEDALLGVLDCGAQDAEEIDSEIIIETDYKELASVRESLKTAGYQVIEAELIYKPNSTVEVTEDASGKLERLLDMLEDHDDVQSVYTNAK